MSLHTLILEQKPIDVALSKSGTRLAVLSNDGVAVYALDIHKRPLPRPALLWRRDAFKACSPRHVTFLRDERIYVLTDAWDEDESHLWRSEGEELFLQGPLVESERVSTLMSSVDYETLYVQLENGALHQISTEETSTDLPPQTVLTRRLPTFCPEVQIAHSEGQVCSRHVSTRS